MQSAWAEEDDIAEASQWGGGVAPGVDDAALAAKLQEEEDFRRLQAKYGFTTEVCGLSYCVPIASSAYTTHRALKCLTVALCW